jgi:hypothetical protein
MVYDRTFVEGVIADTVLIEIERFPPWDRPDI